MSKGHYPYGTPPKGYSKDSSRTKTPLLIPNGEASLIAEAFEIFSTGLYTSEHVRKICAKSGLKIGRTQFGLLLRNPVYVGKIYVPELNQEPACLVDGVHQGIVSEKAFSNVQRIDSKKK